MLFRTSPVRSVHKLSRQIQIINAYCRETEAVKNSTHDLLWALLNEMIDTHNYLLTQSVYGASKTNTVLPHIQQLMNLMPDFTKRLEQRIRFNPLGASQAKNLTQAASHYYLLEHSKEK